MALVAVVGVILSVYRWEASRSPAICQVCGRDIPKQTAYRMATADGSIKACYPSCAMHYTVHNPGTVRESWASDFSFGKLIPAATAYYDEGGDTQCCTAHHPGVERGPQGVSALHFEFYLT